MSKNIFVISDTHFSHTNIIKYCDRPFNDAEEMNEKLVENWNKVVKPQDKVYHLGDVYMSAKREYIDHLLSRLNGHKRLILGNHDNGRDQILHKYFEKINVWRQFTEFGLLLTHVPVHIDTITGGVDRHDQPKVLKNIHGHTHTNGEPRNNKIQDKKNYKCVCVELINYTPVHIDELRIR